MARGGRALRLSHWSPEKPATVRPQFRLRIRAREGLADVIVGPGRLTGAGHGRGSRSLRAWLVSAARARRDAGLETAAAPSCWRRPGCFRPVGDHALDVRRSVADPVSRRRVEPEKIVIDDGDIITAGGLMAWTDLGMRLIDRLLGPSIMVETSRFFLVDASGREQRHYGSFAPRLTHGDEAILKVQHWLQVKGARAVGVADMAREAGLEERTFLRRFKAATGIKPTEYAQCVRMEKARELLQFTRRTIDQIAWSVGYEDADRVPTRLRSSGRLVARRLSSALRGRSRSQPRLRAHHDNDQFPTLGRSRTSASPHS